MVQDLVLGDVVEGVLKAPVGEGVDLGQATEDGGALVQVNVRALHPLPTGAAVEHDVAASLRKAALEGLHLADAVVLLDVHLPQVGTVLGVVLALVLAVLGLEDLGLEVVGLLDLLQELHSLGEEMESVHHHHLALAVGQVSQAVEQVSDDAIASNQGVGEHRVRETLHGKLKGTHGLLLQMLQALVLRLGNEVIQTLASEVKGLALSTGGDGQRLDNPLGLDHRLLQGVGALGEGGALGRNLGVAARHHGRHGRESRLSGDHLCSHVGKCIEVVKVQSVSPVPAGLRLACARW
mmetsp:Transcript_26389/g.57319  ORF Transcript_26389/g.57319 Transcript_26389/m.57319 type:complete len:294 (+) Transcript_26389:758-1639(+)